MTMPNFLIIGAAKSGTTSLWHYLKQHPQIYMSPIKEPMFFAFEGEDPDFRDPRPSWVVTDLEAYRALFGGVTDEVAVGEASTYYLYREKAPGRIRHYVPEAKLIAILRDPAERAYSHFLMARRNGREWLTDFARALEVEEGRIEDNWWIGHYKRIGFYHEQLSRYYELFEREQIRVYLYEDLNEDPVGMMQSIFRFLEVDDAFVPDTSLKYNVSPRILRSRALQTFIEKPNPLKPLIKPFLPEGLRRSILINLRNRNLTKPPLPEKVREELTKAYREDILKLQGLIRRDLSSWLER